MRGDLRVDDAAIERARAAVTEYRRRLGMAEPLDWNDPRNLNHGVQVVVACIAAALAEYAREQVTEQHLWWRQLLDARDTLQARLNVKCLDVDSLTAQLQTLRGEVSDYRFQRDRLIQEKAALEDLLKGAAHALRSYQYANASPDLAQTMADRIDAALAPRRG